MITWKRIRLRQCSEHNERCDGQGDGEEENLRELVSDFFNLFSLLADDCPVELLIHNQVFGAFVLLVTGARSFSDLWKTMVPKHRTCSHHSLDHLDEFSASQLDSLWVAFDPDQVAALRVLGDPHRHFVLLLDAIDWSERREKHRSALSLRRKTKFWWTHCWCRFFQ